MHWTRKKKRMKKMSQRSRIRTERRSKSSSLKKKKEWIHLAQLGLSSSARARLLSFKN